MIKNIMLFVVFSGFLTILCAAEDDEHMSARVISADVKTWISYQASNAKLSNPLTIYRLDPIVVINSSSSDMRFQTIVVYCANETGTGTGMEIYLQAGKDSLTATLLIPPHKLFQNAAEVITLGKGVSLQTSAFITCPAETGNRIHLSIYLGSDPIFLAYADIPEVSDIPPHRRTKEGLPLTFKSQW